MSKRLYVGNLSYSIKTQELEEIFKQVGEVVFAKVMIDIETGRSKGFAFVEMATDDLAAKAIERLNEKDVGGRPLRVTEASPRPERPPGSGNRFGGKRVGGFSNSGRGRNSQD